MDWLEQNKYLSLADIDTITAEVEMQLTNRERAILDQVELGVAVRMACLDVLTANGRAGQTP